MQTLHFIDCFQNPRQVREKALYLAVFGVRRNTKNRRACVTGKIRTVSRRILPEIPHQRRFFHEDGHSVFGGPLSNVRYETYYIVNRNGKKKSKKKEEEERRGAGTEKRRRDRERERERERDREREKRERQRERRERERSDGWLLRGKRPVRAEEDGGEGEDDDDDFLLWPNPCTCNEARRWLLWGHRSDSVEDENQGRRRRGRERVLRRDSQVLERLEDERVHVLRETKRHYRRDHETDT